ncbi:predicted protein [Chaetoceros tenuissimus]|uniref:Uncharacterized protein n=1 Tax=Chaetoceros tenuissimus TaxID=426638 RepID=A0AAD3CMW5_9STRA|nr:predicted protein [Chaetoceros tenuissimus]
MCTCSKYRLKVKQQNKEMTLIKHQLELEADENQSTNLPRDINTEINGKKEIKRKLMLQSFQSNFKGARKNVCLIGHKNEPKVIQNFARDANEGKLSTIASINKVVAVFTTGLVGKKGLLYIKDSIDALAVVQTTDNNNDELEIWGVEIKTRVRVSTKEYNKEKEFQSRLLNITDLDEKLYRRKLSERTQILHHSYVYNLTKIMFIVADVNGKIIHGNAVKLSENLLRDYGECLKAMYGDALS